MSLRSGNSYFQSLETRPLAAPPLEGNAACDTAVLGGGVTGALIAYHLAREGVDTLLVDKRELAAGSTAASTGLLQYEVDTPLVDLIEKVGQADAVHAYRRGLKAIDEIGQLTAELGDDCGFARRETLYFASHFWHRRRLKREYECRRQFGFDVAFLDRGRLAEISSIQACGAILARGDAQIDPYRFTRRLLERAQSAGARLHAKTEVLDVHESPSEVCLQLKRGTIRARRIVFAAGYDSYRYLPKHLGRLHSTYAAASEPIADFSGWPDETLIWETARPYFYARQTADGRAIIGGADTALKSDHRRAGLMERQVERLQRRFGRLFPAIEFTPAFAWSGIFGESQDGLAYIGQTRARPRAYFAVGYGGNGITFSMIAARLITDLYFERPCPDAEVFRFGR